MVIGSMERYSAVAVHSLEVGVISVLPNKISQNNFFMVFRFFLETSTKFSAIRGRFDVISEKILSN
jgi:hypothetical protein